MPEPAGLKQIAWFDGMCRVYDDRDIATPLLDFLRSIIPIIDPGNETMALVLSCVPARRTFKVATPFLSYELEVSPIIRVILSKSIDELHHQITCNYDSVLETVGGFTTLHLCREWALGLKRLLQTRARPLLYERDPNGCNFFLSLCYDYPGCCSSFHVNPDVLSLLLDQGFSPFPENSFHTLTLHLDTRETENIQIIAEHMANRLQRLYEQTSARLLDTLMTEFKICLKQDYHGKTVSDFISGYWQHRIQNLDTAREDEIEKMERTLGKVQTNVWPQAVERLIKSEKVVMPTSR